MPFFLTYNAHMKLDHTPGESPNRMRTPNIFLARLRLTRLVALLCIASAPLATQAISVLSPGDIAITGFNGKGNDDFAFLCLVPIDAGVPVMFDVQIPAGHITWTAPNGGVAAGTVVVVQNPKDGDAAASATTGTLVEAGYNYDSAGDALVVLQGANPVFASETLVSYTPPAALSYGAGTAINHTTGVSSNGLYNGTRSGTRQQLLAAIGTPTNWLYSASDPGPEQNTAPYNQPFTISSPGGSSWSSLVVDGWEFAASSRGEKRLSLITGAIVSIQTDSNNAPAESLCYASKGDTISASKGFAAYFANTLPAGSSIVSAKIRVQHQGAALTSGALQIHVSDNRFATSWYNGTSTTFSVANSGDIAWSATEAEAIYDVTSVLNTADKVNNCEVIILNRINSTAIVYFDYIWIDVAYIGSGAPSVDNASGASAIQSGSATLNGQVLDGSPTPNVYVLWGDHIGGPFTNQWDFIEDLGPLGIGPFARNVTGLTASKTYYYRCFATNSFGPAWAPTNATFATAPAVIQFTSPNSSGAEANGNAPIGLSLSAPSTLPVSVTVSATGGSAASPADYTFTTTNVTIPAGQVSASVNLTLFDDALNEDDETVLLSLSAPVNGTLGANNSHTFSILDNDPLPAIAFSAATYNANEGAPNALLTLTKPTASGRSASVQYQTLNGDALAGSDYSNTAGTVTWPPGDVAPKDILISMINDAAPEPVEQFFVNLFTPVNATISGTTTATVNLADDDLGPPAISNGEGPTAVSSNAATLRGELLSAGGTTTVVRIYYGLSDGGTTIGSWASNVLMGTLAEGVFSNRVTGLSTNRTYFYRCAASNAFGLTWAPFTTNFLTGPPSVSFVTASSSGLEGTSPLLLPITLSTPSVYGDDVIVNFARTGGSATPNTDFSFPSTTVTIRAGMTMTNVTINLLDDALSEKNEHIVVTLTSAGNAHLGSPVAHDFTITDDDPLPQILFLGAPYTVAENAGSVTIQAKLNVPAGRSVDANYSTFDGTAFAGVNYQAKSGEVQWNTGQTFTTNIVIPIINDAISTGDRAFEFRLLATGNDVDLTNVTDRAIVNIIEDDLTPPQVSNGNGASGVRASMAILNGKVFAGVPPPQIRVYWGIQNGGTTPSAWSRTNVIGTQSGDFSTEIYGLLPNTTYFYRCFASNGVGTAWATNSATFSTVTGNNYFVNDTSLVNDVYCTAVGNDANAGTSAATPMATVNMVVDTYNLGPGDTVYIDTGLYNQSSTIVVGAEDLGSAGTGLNVLFRGSPHADRTILASVSGFDSFNLSGVTDAVYVGFEKLQIQGGRRGFVIIGDPDSPARGVRIQDCTVNNHGTFSTDAAVFMRYCTESWVVGCNVFSNNMVGIYFNACTSSGAISNSIAANSRWGLRSRFCLAPEYAHNTSSRNGNDGIIVSEGGGSERILFNTAYSNTLNGLYVQRDSGEPGLIHGNRLHGNSVDGLKLLSGGFTVSRNTIWQNADNGLDSPGDKGLLCINNLIFNNTSTNVSFTGANNLVFEHNTVYGGSGVYFNQPVAVTNRHNIVWATGEGGLGIDVTVIPSDPAVLFDYNCLRASDPATVGRWGGTACEGLSEWQFNTGKDLNSINPDPLFVDIGLGDFHLQSLAGSYHGGNWLADANNSPCIDAATPTAAFSNEPAYNGLYANLGLEGNTEEASKTYYTGAFYTVAIMSAPPGAGTAFIVPAAASYPTNRLVTIWALPAISNFVWQGWTGSLMTASITNSFFVTANMSMTAQFVPATDTNYTGAYYTLTLNRSPLEAGTVSANPLLASYPTNLPVTVWATLTNAAYAWLNWTGHLQSAAMTNVIYITTNMTFTAIYTAVISNTNGVPGSWLTSYGIPNTQGGADADTDGDGMRNWQEFYAGTIPTNLLSVLRTAMASPTGNQRDAMTFLATTGKLYRVQLSTNLPSRLWAYWPAAVTSNGVTSLSSVQATAATMTVYMDPPTNVRARAYRVDLNYIP